MPPRISRRLRAKADQLDIWLYVATDNMSAADKLASQFDEAVAMLADYPEAGRGRPELGTGIRSFPVEHFIIFYRVLTNRIEIVRILSSYRDITPEMLSD